MKYLPYILMAPLITILALPLIRWILEPIAIIYMFAGGRYTALIVGIPLAFIIGFVLLIRRSK
jgi:hypothetical protein